MSTNGNGIGHSEGPSSAASDTHEDEITLDRPQGTATLEIIQSLCTTIATKVAVIERRVEYIDDIALGLRALITTVQRLSETTAVVYQSNMRMAEAMDRITDELQAPKAR